MKHVSKLLVVEYENSLHENDVRGIDSDALIGQPLMTLEVVSGNLNDARGLYVLQCLDGQVEIERVWVVEVIFPLERQLLFFRVQITVETVLRKQDDLALFVRNRRLPELLDDARANRSLPTGGASSDSDKERSLAFHGAVCSPQGVIMRVVNPTPQDGYRDIARKLGSTGSTAKGQGRSGVPAWQSESNPVYRMSKFNEMRRRSPPAE